MLALKEVQSFYLFIYLSHELHMLAIKTKTGGLRTPYTYMAPSNTYNKGGQGWQGDIKVVFLLLT